MLLFVSSKHSLQGGAKSISSTEALLPQLQVRGPPGRCWVHVPCGSTSCSPLAGLDESPLLHKNVPWYTSISTKWISPVVRIRCSACPVAVTSFPWSPLATHKPVHRHAPPNGPPENPTIGPFLCGSTSFWGDPKSHSKPFLSVCLRVCGLALHLGQPQEETGQGASRSSALYWVSIPIVPLSSQRWSLVP